MAHFDIQETETTTRRLMGEHLATVDHNDHARFCAALMVGKVFVVEHASSLPVHRVDTLAAALFQVPTPSLQAELTRMVKAKVLRSRMIKGERHYEVNY